MGERFVWDEDCENISLVRASKEEEEQKKRKKISQLRSKAKIYCPHSNLLITFRENLSPSQKIKFKKNYMRKITPLGPDVVLLQDIKTLVLFLISGHVSPRFIEFFHLPIVDRFLRILIIYFQFYIETWLNLTQKRDTIDKKAENPLAKGTALKRAEVLSCLRCIIGKEYSDMILGHENGIRYHHMMAGEKPLIQSQHEKDLIIFETLIRVAHRVVWIALQRIHFNLIETELDRLFRTDSFNTSGRKNNELKKNLLENDFLELHGPKMLSRRKIQRNSSLIQEIFSDCDFRLLSLGFLNTNDPRIIYLQNALFLDEEKLPEYGIRIGILGMPRSNFDIFLLPLRNAKTKEGKNYESCEDKNFHRAKAQKQTNEKKIPDFGSDPELHLEFLTEPSITPSKNWVQMLKKADRYSF